MRNALRIVFSILLIMVAGFAAVAQESRPSLIPAGEPEGPSLGLRSLRVEVVVAGTVAETTMTMVFGNDTSRDLEADLYVPLPAGATVSGYALDVRGVMVDGVPVERNKARQTFDAIVRRGIDPGLVEWTQGNVFKTRVFPVPRNGSRTIRISYVSDLTEASGGFAYRLPLSYSEPVADFSVRVEVVEGERMPTITQGDIPGLAFGEWRRGYVAEAHARNAILGEDLVVLLPPVVADRPALQTDDEGRTFFSLRFDKADAAPTEASVRTIDLYWDASRSRAGHDHERMLGILSDYLRYFAGRTITVRVIAFRDRSDAPREFTIRRGAADELIDFLRDVPYDGATRFDTLPPPESDVAILVSDGLATIAAGLGRFAGTRTYVFSTGTEVNAPRLEGIAQNSGGTFIDLARVDDRSAVLAIGSPVYHVIAADVRGGRVEGLVTRDLGDSIAVVGRLDSDEAQLRVTLGYGSIVEEEVTRTLRRRDAVEGDVLAVNWAQKRLHTLLADERGNEDEISTLGSEFGLVTPGTSLMVLESLDQYVEFKIEPPESLREMRDAYFTLVNDKAREEAARVDDKLTWVLSEWRARVDWWGREFKPELPPGRGGPPVDDGVETEEESQEPIAELSGTGDSPSTRDLRRNEVPTGDFSGAGESSPQRQSVESVAAGESSRADGAAEPRATREAGIGLEGWNPDTPYLRAIRSARGENRYRRYLEFAADEYARTPSFYLDVGDYFEDEGDVDLALRVWSNLVELELESPELMRVLAHRLDQAGREATAIILFEQVLEMRPDQPQSYRDLALVLARQEEYARAIELLWRVVEGQWERFAGIEQPALMELNRLIPIARLRGVDYSMVDERFIAPLDVDLRVVLTWDADLTDMDLWVTGPSGERIYYANPRGMYGEHLSRDFVQGYGPEEFFIRKGQAGAYQIQAHYYGSSAVDLTGSVTVQAEIFTNYGRPGEERRSVTFRLRGRDDVIDIGSVQM